MTWTPSDALVEKAARAMCEADGYDWSALDEFRDPADVHDPMCKASARAIARAALIAAYPDMVAEAVRAEAEACAAIAKHYADRDHEAGVKAQRRANRLGNDPFGHGDMARSAAFELDAAEREARAIEAAIRARHP